MPAKTSSSSTSASLTKFRLPRWEERSIPQGEVPGRLAEIPQDREVVVQCRSGARSQRIAEFLAQSGYPNVKNLAGGILAWADQIDPKVQKY